MGPFKEGWGLNYERQLFHTHPGEVDLVELTPFYRSLMLAWQKTLTITRDLSSLGVWVWQEPLFHNSLEDRAVSVQESTGRQRDCGNDEP